jgi:hypothetical protein
MPVLLKRARQLKAARCSKKVKWSSEDHIHIHQELLDRLDDDSEEGSWNIGQGLCAAEDPCDAEDGCTAEDPYTAAIYWEGYADTSDGRVKRIASLQKGKRKEILMRMRSQRL